MVYLCRWSVEELRYIFVGGPWTRRGGAQSLKGPEFKPAEIGGELHNRIACAVHNKMIKSFDMCESSRDGDQNLRGDDVPPIVV